MQLHLKARDGDHRTCLTDEMCMTITCDLSCSPNFCLFVDHKVQSRWGNLGCRLYSKRRHYQYCLQWQKPLPWRELASVVKWISHANDANFTRKWWKFHAANEASKFKMFQASNYARIARFYSRKSRLVCERTVSACSRNWTNHSTDSQTDSLVCQVWSSLWTELTQKNESFANGHRSLPRESRRRVWNKLNSIFNLYCIKIK